MAGNFHTTRRSSMATGQRYGRLTVIEFVEVRGKKDQQKAYWRFRCDCGNETVVMGTDVRRGNTTSCGCVKRQQRLQHGLSYSPEWKAWISIRQRCFKSSNNAFKYYGGRGIKVCKQWLIFENFYADMGPRPSRQYSIDRIDNNGDYEPGNCRWASHKEQQRNKRDTFLVQHQGQQIPLIALAQQAGLSPGAVRRRIYRGWTLERALTTPIDTTRLGKRKSYVATTAES